jgi:hypothetical protein
MASGKKFRIRTATPRSTGYIHESKQDNFCLIRRFFSKIAHFSPTKKDQASLDGICKKVLIRGLYFGLKIISFFHLKMIIFRDEQVTFKN